MTYNLFLDDYRQPEDTFAYTNNQLYLIGWDVVKTYNEFVKIILEKGMPEMISFDHDLSDEHYDPDLHGSETYSELYDNYVFKTGYDCAKWLINYCMDNNLNISQTILIHSMNPQGGCNIESLFNTYSKAYGLDIEVERYIIVFKQTK